MKRSPQEEDSDDTFSFADYDTQEDFWAEWNTLEAFLTEHAPQFTSEDDFWQQFEAALPTQGTAEPFNFAGYATQEDFWAEFDTVENFLAEYPDQFANEDQFWHEFEAAVPIQGTAEVTPAPADPTPAPEDPAPAPEDPAPAPEDPVEQPDPIIVVGPTPR